MIDFKAHENRINEQIQMAWITGLYTKMALQTSVLVCGLADKKVISKMPQYPEMPTLKEDLPLTEEQIEAERQYAIAKMNTWVRMNNKKKKQ